MADCATCKEKEKQVEPIPFIAFESVKASMERTIKRLWIVIIILIVLLCGSNVAWIAYEGQFEDVVVTQEVEQEADNGTNTFIGGDYIGEAKSENDG